MSNTMRAIALVAFFLVGSGVEADGQYKLDLKKDDVAKPPVDSSAGISKIQPNDFAGKIQMLESKQTELEKRVAELEAFKRSQTGVQLLSH